MISFNIVLLSKLNRMHRIAYPVNDGQDWIGPFIVEPHDAYSLDYKKIKIRDKTVRLLERQFKIIDTGNFIEPISLETGWSTDLDAKDMRILSCCKLTLKLDSLIKIFEIKHQCASCRKTHFINELGDPLSTSPGEPLEEDIDNSFLYKMRSICKRIGLITLVKNEIFKPLNQKPTTLYHAVEGVGYTLLCLG